MSSKFVAAARELRDRYLEPVNNDPTALPASSGKYDVYRQIEATPMKETVKGLPSPSLLDAA